MVCSPNMWRVATRVWPRPTMLLHGRPHQLVVTQAKISFRRHASNDGSGRTQRGPPLPRNFTEAPQTGSIRSLTEEMNSATDDATKEKLFEQYIRAPHDMPTTGPRPSSGPRTVADVLLSENRRLVRWSFAYAGLVGLSVFGGAVLLSHADERSLKWATARSSPSIEDLRATRQRHELSVAQQSVDALRKYVDKSTVQTYAKWRLAWLNASDAKKAAYLIAGANIAVCIAWQISMLALRSPKMSNFVPFMMRWFLHAPLEPQPLVRMITPITHIFSHRSIMHLLFNNIAMVSFATSAGLYISSRNVQSGGQFAHGYREPQELSGTYQFLAFFLTAGVFASLGSTLHAQFLQKRILQSKYPSLEGWRRASTPGLGASGAVYSVIVVSALADPDGRIGIAFLTNIFPFLNAEKKYGIVALVGLDVFGLLRGWTTFGHATHLGGAAFGALYYNFGPRIWAKIRGPET